ncbi:MAG: hypothetical protein ACI86H_001078 [bacterium]|jgi:hypothetical protein
MKKKILFFLILSLVWIQGCKDIESDIGKDANTQTGTAQGLTANTTESLSFTIPSGTTKVYLNFQMAGDFDSSSEYATVLFDSNSLGTVNTGEQSSTLHTPTNWANKEISSSYWTAGSTITIDVTNSSSVNFNPGGGFYYKYIVTLVYE